MVKSGLTDPVDNLNVHRTILRLTTAEPGLTFQGLTEKLYSPTEPHRTHPGVQKFQPSMSVPMESDSFSILLSDRQSLLSKTVDRNPCQQIR